MIASAFLIPPLVSALLLCFDLYGEITKVLEEVPVDEGYSME